MKTNSVSNQTGDECSDHDSVLAWRHSPTCPQYEPFWGKSQTAAVPEAKPSAPPTADHGLADAEYERDYQPTGSPTFAYSPDTRKFTDRGFEDFTDFRDTYGSRIIVRESSSAAGPHVWIFAQDNPEMKEPSPHLDLAQAREVAEALMRFVDRFSESPEGEVEHEEGCPCYGDVVEHSADCANCTCAKPAAPPEATQEDAAWAMVRQYVPHGTGEVTVRQLWPLLEELVERRKR